MNDLIERFGSQPKSTISLFSPFFAAYRISNEHYQLQLIASSEDLANLQLSHCISLILDQSL